MAKKSKQRAEVERAIVRGHKIGMCDASGRSVTDSTGRMVAAPRKMRPTFRMKFVDGVKHVFRDGEWSVCES